MDRTDCIVLGVSVAGAAAALRLAEVGKSVVVVELPEEVPLRARTLVWGTPLSNRDRTGANFESLVERTLDKAGARVIREVEEASLVLGGEPQLKLRRFDDATEIEISAPQCVYASDGAWNAAEIPAATKVLMGKGVSASAWVDSTFYIGKSGAIAGGGDFAFEQLYWAGQCASELWWLCPDPRAMVSEDLLDRVELPVSPTLHTSAEIKSVRRESSRIHIGLGSGETIMVHAAFFALHPHHDLQKLAGVSSFAELKGKGVVAAGTAAGFLWTDHAGIWQSGWDAVK